MRDEAESEARAEPPAAKAIPFEVPQKVATFLFSSFLADEQAHLLLNLKHTVRLPEGMADSFPESLLL